MVVSNSVDSVDRVLPSDSADRSSVYREVKLPHSGNTSVPVVGDVVMKKHVFKPRRVGFDDQVVRHSVLNNTRISGHSTRGSGAGGMRRKGLYTVMMEQVMSRGTWRTACTVAFLPPDF